MIEKAIEEFDMREACGLPPQKRKHRKKPVLCRSKKQHHFVLVKRTSWYSQHICSKCGKIRCEWYN